MDKVFTVDYSIRSSQLDIYTLFDLKRMAPPVFKGHDVSVLFNVLKIMYK